MEHRFKTEFENIHIVPLTREDAEKYRLLRNQKEIRNCFEYNSVISHREQMSWYENYLKSPNEYMFSIYDTYGHFLGCNSLYQIDLAEKTSEYGRIVIDKQYSGNAFGYKATMAAMIIAEEQLKLNEVFLDVYINNFSAIYSYKKAHFEPFGTISDSRGIEMMRMRCCLANK